MVLSHDTESKDLRAAGLKLFEIRMGHIKHCSIQEDRVVSISIDSQFAEYQHNVGEEGMHVKDRVNGRQQLP